MSLPTDDPQAAYRDEHKNEKINLSTSAGRPIGDVLNSLTIGPRGPLLMQDYIFMDMLAHFNREKIPERIVHAKGAGALGYFECTHDITKYTKMAPFAKIGKKTDVRVRFSTVGMEAGSADTVREPRGIGLKFYTEDGNWDLAGLNTPIFFIRDPILFPSFVHSQKRNPRTHLSDANSAWDFQALRPETTHNFCLVFSERGLPNGYRHMNVYGTHTFKLINAENQAVYNKFIFKTNQGIDNLTAEKATALAGTDPDYGIKDLFNAIETKNFPSWTLYVQVMTYEQAQKSSFNPFDVTKVWPHAEYPLIEVGQMVLNQNPKNYFVEVEEAAFNPASFINGIEASPDKLLQGRLFAYGDAQRYRLGANYNLLSSNKPVCPFGNYQIDGAMRFDNNHGDMPTYYPNTYGGPKENPHHLEHKEQVSGEIYRHDSGDEDNFSQATIFYTKVLDKDGQSRLASNIADSLSHANEAIRVKVVNNFCKVHKDLGKDILAGLEKRGAKTDMSTSGCLCT